MKQYKTWLNDQFIEYTLNGSLVGNTIRPGALVEADSMEKVFEVTNNIDGPWTHNPEVKKVFTSSPRSLSVGDLVQDLDENKFYVVQSFGFKKVSNEEYESLNFEVKEI